MPPITTLLLVALVIGLWIGVVAVVWAVLSGPNGYSSGASRATPED